MLYAAACNGTSHTGFIRLNYVIWKGICPTWPSNTAGVVASAVFVCTTAYKQPLPSLHRQHCCAVWYLYIVSSTVDTVLVKVVHGFVLSMQVTRRMSVYYSVHDVLGGCLTLTVLVSLLLTTNSAIPQGLFSGTLVPLIHPTPCHTHTNVVVSNVMWCGGWVNGESGYWRRQHVNSSSKFVRTRQNFTSYPDVSAAFSHLHQWMMWIPISLCEYHLIVLSCSQRHQWCMLQWRTTSLYWRCWWNMGEMCFTKHKWVTLVSVYPQPNTTFHSWY